jgi:iron complex outermembrane receptor protein
MRTAFTWLDARFREAFCAPACAGAVTPIPAGNKIPGIAARSAYAALAWEPLQGWRAGIEGRTASRIYANDRNDDFAPGYLALGANAGYLWRLHEWELNAWARLDNLLDRRYAGSVIINEGNARYFEPAPGRNWSAGLSVSSPL